MNIITYEKWLQNVAAPDDKKCLNTGIYQCYNDKAGIVQRVIPTAKIIAEIGVRAGYSAHAFLSVLKDARVYIGYDLFESYTGWGRGKENVEMLLQRDFPDVFSCFVQANTRHFKFIGLKNVDLFNIDGDHTTIGCYQDMKLAWPTIRSGGVMLVDDYDFLKDVKAGVDKFIAEMKIEILSVEHVSSYRGDMILVKK